MNTNLFEPSKLLLIAGPCALESAEMAHETAKVLKNLQDTHISDLKVIYKASFDKANRTSMQGRRGVGLEAGLEILSDIKKTYHLPVSTDIHESTQAYKAAEVCDVLQIPAFLCRQTDLLRAAAQTGRVVHVKKGQFLAPTDMKFIVGKLESFQAREIWQTERGTTFGYGNLVVDMRGFSILRQNHCPVIFDATHSLQMPGTGTGVTGGDRQYLEPLAWAALSAGAQGLFVETHPNPAEAVSDAATQVPLAQFPTLIGRCLKLWKCLQTL